ncbi:hypothetical protein E2C01_085115 [Portunus trituberculatus]|uniref:Uncharacterized protein n=1 Tax=Portunus trituberculatus TaxID=210409 RepID=A0A5B7J6Q8_PORTR|nr:hypothetical protein [Portunus trituberculatus]
MPRHIYRQPTTTPGKHSSTRTQHHHKHGQFHEGTNYAGDMWYEIPLTEGSCRRPVSTTKAQTKMEVKGLGVALPPEETEVWTLQHPHGRIV